MQTEREAMRATELIWIGEAAQKLAGNILDRRLLLYNSSRITAQPLGGSMIRSEIYDRLQ